MKKDKQEKVLSILSSGRYTEIDGNVYSVRSGVIKLLKPNKLKTGYSQVKIFNGRRGTRGLNAVVYVHHVVWILNNGIYDENLEIDHIDNDRTNNRITNLRVVSKAENLANRKPSNRTKVKTIRRDQINEIERLHNLGLSQSAIARELDLNRLSVRYIIKKLESGLAFKYR